MMARPALVLSTTALLLSLAALGVDGKRLRAKNERGPGGDKEAERKLHVPSTGGGDGISSDSHGNFVNSSPVCHGSSSAVNGCGTDDQGNDLYLDICNPNLLLGSTFSQSACGCLDRAGCEATGGSIMMDMDTGVSLCIRSEEQVCAEAHPDYKRLNIMADMHNNGSVHYWGCQCIRNERNMEPLITARTFTPPTTPDPSILRFNKFDFSGSIPGNVFIKNFPTMTDAEKLQYENVQDLTSADYPITASSNTVDFLRKSNAISVITEDDYEIKQNVQDVIAAIGGPPTHPICDVSSSFWDELQHVVDVAKYRRASGNEDSANLASHLQSLGYDDWLPHYIPALWNGDTVTQLAEHVHDEPPGDWQAQLIHQFLQEGLEVDYDIMPKRSAVEFIGAVVRLYDMNTHFINYVAPHNFAAKWHAGRARPEEVVHAIVNGKIDPSCVPPELYDDIIDNFSDLAGATFDYPFGASDPDGTDFTAYSEGSPRHPSWPAMHSAASNVSFWMQVVFKLTDAQVCEAMKIDYGVSYARTIAGVHYKRDNLDGLNMGKEVIRRDIAKYLHDHFDADEAAAQAKADAIAASFDWNNYKQLFDQCSG